MNRLRKTALLLALISLLVLSSWLPGATSAQESQEDGLQNSLVRELQELTEGKVRISTHAKTGKVRFIGTELSNPIPQPDALKASAGLEGAARGFLSRYGKLFGLVNQSSELAAMQSKTVHDGRSFMRFQQIYEGVPIVGGELIIQVSSPNNNVISANGEILPDIIIDTTPAIAASSAQEAALNVVVKEYGIEPGALIVSEPELWIYNPIILGMNADFTALVWQMEVESVELLPVRELVLVDAHLGAIALHFNQIDTLKDREVYDASCNSTLPGTLVRSEGDTPTGDADQDNAYDYSGDTYDFYSNEHGRDSIDNAGMTIISTVDYDDDGIGCNYANAYWSGTQMVYGPGFVADDVVAHELTHGVTDYESNLMYYMQSGAINEAFSDIWGEFVDQTNSSGNDTLAALWLMGEDLSIGAIRDMEDPTAYGDPDKMTSTYYYGGSADNGGVHSNSGVANKAAYLMVDGDTFNSYNVTGMDISKTADVWYEVQTNLLTSAGDYADLYDSLQQAAINLGYSPEDKQTVMDAVDATEMNQQPTSGAATEAPVCDTGTPNNLWFDDLENTGSGNWASAAIVGTNEWYYPQNSHPYTGYDATYATSGVYNLWGYDQSSIADYYIAMTSNVTLPSGAYLHFNHAYRFEIGAYDGGVVEYSLDGGASWNDAGGLFTHNGYTGTIQTLPNPAQRNPLAGQSAFVNFSNGYISSRLDLSSLAGESVRFRFRIGTDYTGYAYGWFIDDIRIYNCDTAPPTMEPIAEAEGQYYSTAPSFSNFGFDDDVALDDGWYQMDSYSGNWTVLFANVTGTSYDKDGREIPEFAGLSEGSHTIYFKASDDVSNVEGESGEWSWQFYKDTVLPTDPTSVNSTSHTVSTWSSDNTVDITWTDATDATSGLDGYSILWNTANSTIPDATKDIEEGVQSANSTALADGNSHYFHIRSVDNAGNWQSTVHFGPFFIDAANLPTMEAIAEAEGQYYNTAPVFANFGFDDNVALDDGWYQMNSFNGTWTALFTDVTGTSWDSDNWTIPVFGALSQGSHTIYFKASDDASNVEGESGEWSWQFYKDTVLPTDPTSVNSTSHTPSVWSSDNTVDVIWTDATDTTSGLDGYSILWNTANSTIPDAIKDIEEGVQSANSTALADGNSHYFHIRSVDNAGNWQSTVHLGPFFIDTTPPTDPTSVNSTSHTPSVWSSDNTVDVIWTDATDTTSGLDGYSILWNTDNATIPNQTKDIEEGVQSANSTALADGNSHYFHIRSVDNAGNWQSTVHLGPFFIAAVSPVLSDGAVSPTSGYTSANFTYSVNYTNFDNDAPSPITISIDGGTSANMTIRAGQVGDFTIGKIYEYTATGAELGTDSHTFQFAASDGTDNAIGDIDSHDGPTVSSPPVAGGGGGGGGGGGASGVTSVFDIITPNGRLTQDVTAESDDGEVELFIAKNTICLTETGYPLRRIIMRAMEEPPEPPADSKIIGLAYDFTPDGVTFNPPAILTFTYDPALIPDGATEDSLVIAWWDEESGEWVNLVSTVDPATNTITAEISGFTVFTVLAYTRPAAFTTTDLAISPTEVNAGDTVTISTVVTNTGDLSGSYQATLKIDSVAVATKEVTLAGGASEKITFTTFKDVAGSYIVAVNGLSGRVIVRAPPPPSTPAQAPAAVQAPEPAPVPVPAVPPVTPVAPTTPEPAFNWWLVSSIVAGAAIGGLGAYFYGRRRRRVKKED